MNNFKRIALGAAIAATLPVSGAAVAEVSANIAATSNYVWRGVTQTMDQAAVSGGVDYASEVGFYVGTWASNVDFGAGGQTEWDIYGGFAGEVGEIGYDVGVLHYAYPDVDDADFTEIYASVSVAFLTVGAHFTVNSDVTDDGASGFVEDDVYYYASAGFDLGDDWSLGITAGLYDFENDGSGNDITYSHVQLDLGKSAGDMGDFTFSLSTAEEESGDDDLIPFVSWSKSF